MNLKDLISYTRRRLDDVKEPYLWDKADLIVWLNEAQQEAARRARLLVDSVTADVCQYAVAVGEPNVELDPRVLYVRRAKLASQSCALNKADVRDLDRHNGAWESETGEIFGYIQNYDTTYLRLVYIPETADTLNLTVTRLPLEDMAADADEPEIKPHLHLKLHHWACYRAYSDPDTDTRDDEKAAAHLTLFTAEFGPPVNAVEEQWQREQYGYDDLDGVRQ